MTLYAGTVLYTRTVKTAIAFFLSDIIITNSHNPRILFKIFNSVIDPCPGMLDLASPALSEQFLNNFTRKIVLLWASLLHPSVVNPLPTSGFLSTFYQFEPIPLSNLKRLIEQLRSSNSVHDILPSCIIKDGFDVMGPYILSLMDLSVLVGCLPTAFKHTIVQPVLKKTQP